MALLRWKDQLDCVVRLSTERPSGVESITGTTRFVVLASQIMGS